MISRKNLLNRICIFLMLNAAVGINPAQAQYKEEWASLDQRPTPSWWKEAKFGIFIHWGVYSVPAYAPADEVEGVYDKYAEHYDRRLREKNPFFLNHHKKYYGANFPYKNFAPMFRAQYFNPDEWANLFEQSGARYVVLTSKHHDGFCLWPSKESKGWNSKALGPRLDIIDTLSRSVRKKGLRMGLYYSLLQWSHPLYSANTIDQWVDKQVTPQLKDLVNTYHPEIIFADGEWDYDSKVWKSEQFLAWLFNQSPVKENVVVNDRWGKETRSRHGDYYTTEYDLVHDAKGIGKAADHPWEESRGIGTSYGYNQFETNAHYFSSRMLIHLLIEKVSGGGNLLLNIGPQANGLIPVVMQERLLDMGRWLKVNGEAIYGTETWNASKKPDAKKVYFTKKGQTLYAIFTEWPENELKIDGVKKVEAVSLLGSDTPVTFSLKKRTLTVSMPQLTVNKLPSDHAWVLKVEGFEF